MPSTVNENEVEILLSCGICPKEVVSGGGCFVRAPVRGDDSGIADIVDEYISVVTDLWPASDHQLQRIRDETRKDSQLTALLRILQTNWPLTKSALTTRGTDRCQRRSVSSVR